jgi:hypothetical protein
MSARLDLLSRKTVRYQQAASPFQEPNRRTGVYPFGVLLGAEEDKSSKESVVTLSIVSFHWLKKNTQIIVVPKYFSLSELHRSSI